ncbi:hypothetical protein ACWKWU_14150 [Chitinophaga lutea]
MKEILDREIQERMQRDEQFARDIREYNREIDEAVAQIERGEVVSHEEVVRKFYEVVPQAPRFAEFKQLQTLKDYNKEL